MSVWKTTVIGSLVEVVKTWNPSRLAENKDFSYIDLSAVDQDSKQIVGVRKVSSIEAPSRARQLVVEGDILVSTVRPNLNGVAQVSKELSGSTASTGFCVLRPNQKLLDGGYLFQWVKSPDFVKDMVNKATGASYPAVSDRIILESQLPLPSLEEQGRIASILNKADELREKRRAALTKLDNLMQSIFLEMFGDPVRNSRQWNQANLESVFQFRTGKLDSNAAIATGQFPFFTCARENMWIDHYAFDCEALLLAGNNATADYSVKYYNGKFNAYQRTYVITLRDTENSYLYAKFVLEYWLSELKRISKGTNTKYLTMEILNRICIPIPPIKLQQEFTLHIAKINSLKKKFHKSLLELNTLFASLQYRAFRGEI
jgi:type I restriction enzyme, S subunit